MIQGLIGHAWARYNSLVSPAGHQKQVAEAKDGFSKTIEKSTLPESLDKLPSGTRVRKTLAQNYLFDTLQVFHNRAYVFPGDLQELQDAYGNLKEVLKSEAVKEILNEPINKDGDFPMDIAARTGRILTMKLLADSGARTIKNWHSLNCFSDPLTTGFDDVPIQKSKLHENQKFQKLLEMINLSRPLGELHDPEGNTLVHYLLSGQIPEGTQLDEQKVRMEKRENWEKTLEALLKCRINLNAPNHKGELPIAQIASLSCYPITTTRLGKAGAKASLEERPAILVD